MLQTRKKKIKKSNKKYEIIFFRWIWNRNKTLELKIEIIECASSELIGNLNMKKD